MHAKQYNTINILCFISAKEQKFCRAFEKLFKLHQQRTNIRILVYENNIHPSLSILRLFLPRLLFFPLHQAQQHLATLSVF